ncbi:MAG: methylmalonyl Co-A mutase-associated GTPase MeaB [Alphaproteobacteria bacterium]
MPTRLPSRRFDHTPDALAAGVLANDRAMIGRAITMVESRSASRRREAQAMLQLLLPHAGRAFRVGITGVPGVGKSTFIEALGQNLIKRGHQVAVLAVDPTSSRTHGSILGDKTRMATLAADPAAFIRPSPSSGTLGGVAQATRETMTVMEAAGFDVVLVETVGVGQSETAVAEMTDFFLALMLPGAGDELQGIKKGLLEIADMIAVNKADGDNQARAEAAKREYSVALHIMAPASPDWSPPVLLCSGLRNLGLDALWEDIQRHRGIMQTNGDFDMRRQAQQAGWMRAMLEQRLLAGYLSSPEAKACLKAADAAVRQGAMTAPQGVEQVLQTVGLPPTFGEA